MTYFAIDDNSCNVYLDPDNPIALAQELVRCESVTPEDDGALGLLQQTLETLGFDCKRLSFQEPGTQKVDNLYARKGTKEPNFCFAGHSDVVPVGQKNSWTKLPFSGDIDNGYLHGRGSVDMKGAIAAFVTATSRVIRFYKQDIPGSISLLITGDEEGPAINGTRKVLDWLSKKNEKIDACLVGEPTNPDRLGEMIKIGRRGSMTGYLVVKGKQGHVAYPHLADNPISHLLRMLNAITTQALDQGTKHFEPSNLEITAVNVENSATNVIPMFAKANFNIRFNNLHTSEELERWLRDTFDQFEQSYTLDVTVTGEAFLTEPGKLSDIVSLAVSERLGIDPVLSTTGGTSDARFIKDFSPVAEFGLIGKTMHQTNEKVATADIEALTDIYTDVLKRYFES